MAIQPSKSLEIYVSRDPLFTTRKRGLNMASKPRSGRPSKLSGQTTRYIARLARKDDRPSWAAIAASVDGGLSRSTVARVARGQYGQKRTQKKIEKKTQDKNTTPTMKKSSKKAVPGKGPEPAE
ncbi:hypothetical protein N7453_003433 [Penicillium expansum]|nr:hypothetical protein N7453_003433 [Penicillium expansum]